MKSSFKHTTTGIVVRGMAMGMAEVIPGVSGGTIAFITGIYERILDAISGVGPKMKTVWVEDGFKGLWGYFDGTFLLKLAVGMILGIVSGVLGVSYLIENHAEALWAFFFGLIIASIIYVFKKIGKPNYKIWIAFVLGTVVAYVITAMYPMQGCSNLIFVFLAGMIAICALILPGVSGSFMLLIMGMYSLILSSFKNLLTEPNTQDFLLLFVFGLGCLVGLLSFSKIVSKFYKTYPSITLATLAGFMLGSIHKIWPWRNPYLIMDKETNKIVLALERFPGLENWEPKETIKVVMEVNVFPSEYYSEPHFWPVIISALIGFSLVGVLTFSSKN